MIQSMTSIRNLDFAIFICIISCSALRAQPYAHPRLYISPEGRTKFLKKVSQTSWKSDIINRKKQNLEPYLKRCAEKPDWLLSRLQMNWKTRHHQVFLKGGKFAYSSGTAPVPTVRFSGERDWATDYASPPLEDLQPYLDDDRGLYLKNKKSGEMEWVHPSKSGHIIEKTNEKIMNLVADAAFLYWFSGEEKYAAFAAPVYDTYMKGMYYRDAPFDLDSTNQQRLSGLATFEVIHEGIVVPLALTFDFMHDYLKDHDIDLNISADVFRKWADQIIRNGVPDNNWNFFQARFLSYIALVLESDKYYDNGKGQEYYLNQIFNETSERQIALKEAISVYDQETGIWPESPAYSMHVTTTLLRILTLLDNVTGQDEFKNYPIVEKASLAAFQYLFPSGYTAGFGDSGHDAIPSENFELLVANYRKYHETDKELLLSAMLKNSMQTQGNRRWGKGLFELFFFVDQLEETEEIPTDELLTGLTTPAFYAPNVSLFIQRMGTGPNAMMVSLNGSFGNHAHANGISMELFANGYVLAPDMGKGPSYWHPDHRDYYAQMPAHNTVVVDGISSYESMRSYHPFSLDNHYPKTGMEHPVFRQVSYSKVSFVEPKTQSDQQRLTVMLHSETGNGYVIDVFRSKKQDPGKQKHEYFYHNLGQSLIFLDGNNQPLSLVPTEELGTKNGDMKAYDYLTNKKTVIPSGDLKAIFNLKGEGEPDNIMKVWIKNNDDLQLFSAMAPKSNALKGGTSPKAMIGQRIPTLILRKNEEAWRHPFVCVFNPILHGRDNIVSDVAFSDCKGNVSAQKLIVKHSDGLTEDRLIATTSQNDVVEEDSIYLMGLLAVQRNYKDQLSFIFVGGTTKFSWGNWSIISIAQPANVSIERGDNGLIVQNDGPVVVSVPVDMNPGEIECYVNGVMVSKRPGVVGRSNPSQVNFRLEKPYEKVVIKLED